MSPSGFGLDDKIKHGPIDQPVDPYALECRILHGVDLNGKWCYELEGSTAFAFTEF